MMLRSDLWKCFLRHVFIILALLSIKHHTAAQQKNIDSLKLLILSNVNDSSKINIYKELWRNFMSVDIDSASAYAQIGLEFAKSINHRSGTTDFTVYDAYISSVRGNTDKAIKVLQNELKTQREQTPRMVNLEMFLSKWIGQFFMALNELDSAAVYFNRNLTVLDDLPPPLVAGAHLDIAELYYYRNFYHSALSHYLIVDSICNDPDNQNSNCDIIKIMIANVLIKIDDYERAELYYLEGEERLRKADQLYLLFDAHIDRAKYYLEVNQPKQALDLLPNAIQFAKDNNDNRILLRGWKAILRSWIEVGEQDSIRYYEQNILASAKLSKDPLQLADINFWLAQAAYDRQDWSSCKTYLDSALVIFPEWSDWEFEERLYDLAATFYEDRRDLKSALEFHKKHKIITDTLKIVNNESLIKDLEISYDIRQKNNKIVALTEQSVIAKERNRLQRLLFISVSVILLTLLALVYFLYHLRQKAITHLRDLEQLRTTLFANISHEFRTPLTLIQGPLSILNDQELNQVAKDQVKIALRNSNKLVELVGDLNKLILLESGNLEPEIYGIDLKSHLVLISSSFESLAVVRNISFDVEHRIETGEYYYDPKFMESILNNLLSNAFKYTDTGMVKFTSKLNKEQLVMTIEDTGRGIGEIDQENIFERFNRIRKKSDNLDGMGIGLTLVKQLVELHHGSIHLHSVIDQGSTFRIILPVFKNYYTQHGHEIRGIFEPGQTKFNLNKSIIETIPSIHEDEPLILSIEDNPDMRKHLQQIFKNSYRIISANNGVEGLSQAIKYIPDLIISDLMMPKKDGQELLEDIRKDKRTSHIPFILLTANTLESTKIASLKSGVDDFITKPFEISELLAKVDNLIQNRNHLKKIYAQTSKLAPTYLESQTPNQLFWSDLKKVFNENYSNAQFTIEDFAREMHMSRMQLHRKIKAMTDLSASAFLRQQRIKVATQLLEEQNLTVSEIAYETGFSSLSYFSTCFKDHHGISPTEYIQKEIL